MYFATRLRQALYSMLAARFIALQRRPSAVACATLRERADT